jgi:hypothetical protein
MLGILQTGECDTYYILRDLDIPRALGVQHALALVDLELELVLVDARGGFHGLREREGDGQLLGGGREGA